MSIVTAAPPDPCGDVTGTVTIANAAPPFDPVTDRMRATWTAGDFSQIGTGYASGAESFVERLALTPGEHVLDVACGAGNLTLPAAKRGASLTGIDIAPNLVEAARAASAAASLDVRFDVGNAEALPYEDAAFDTVMSMFGVMFTARPERALSELVRVTRPGGRIVLANWTPHGFIGSMLRAHVASVPPPPGSPNVLAWGDETIMRQRLEPYAARLGETRLIGRMIEFVYPLTPAGVVELFRQCYGPTVRTFGALDAQGRADLAAELLRLWSGRNHGPAGTTVVDAEFVEVQIRLAV